MIDETRLTATLPQLDVEIVHREDTDPAAQVVTISLRATPTFRAVADHLSATLPSLLPVSPVISPFLWWTNAIAAAWLPLLAPYSVLAPPPVEGEATNNAAVASDEFGRVADD
jgi:hypothetical protein